MCSVPLWKCATLFPNDTKDPHWQNMESTFSSVWNGFWHTGASENRTVSVIFFDSSAHYSLHSWECLIKFIRTKREKAAQVRIQLKTQQNRQNNKREELRMNEQLPVESNNICSKRLCFDGMAQPFIRQSVLSGDNPSVMIGVIC